jgi:hypothetical protein
LLLLTEVVNMLKKTILLFLAVFVCLLAFPVENSFATIYTVTATVIGGHGTVTPLTQKIKPNSRAIITIKPDAGYHLESITDNEQKMTLASPYAIPFVNENHSVVFTFAINIYSINASVSGGHGKVDPPSQKINHGEKATITITPDEGYKITGIMDNGNPIGITNPLVLNNVTINHSIVVGFVSYTVTASVLGSHGTVTPITLTVGSGGKATFTIKPDVGYQIDKITDNEVVVKTTNPYVITNITSNRKIVVSFTTLVLTIKASVAGGHGQITPAVSEVLYKGQVRLEITSDDGYHITGITDNGVPIAIKQILYLTDITINHTIVVSFVEFSIYARMIEDHGAITPIRQKMFYGGKATITIKPDTGYRISYLIDNGKWKSPTTPTTYVIDSVTEDHLIDVYFAAIYFTVTTSVPGGNGKASPVTQQVRYGSQTTLTFTPDPGYKITGVMDNGKIKMAYSPYVIPSVTENHTVIASFLTYIISASVSGGQGSLSPSIQYINAGAKASLVIIPEAGYRISKIIDNGTVMTTTKSPYIIPKVMENHTIEVQFAISAFTVTVSIPGGHGTATPATQTVDYYQKATLIIKPEQGYRIESILDNGFFMPIRSSYSIFYVTEDHKILIKFIKIK